MFFKPILRQKRDIFSKHFPNKKRQLHPDFRLFCPLKTDKKDNTTGFTTQFFAFQAIFLALPFYKRAPQTNQSLLPIFSVLKITF
jgi:hypothetical protein